MFIEGTCVCGFGPLRARADDADPAWTVEYAPTGATMTECPTCSRAIDGDELLPLPTWMLVGDDDLERVAQLLQSHGQRRDVGHDPADQQLWARVASEQARRSRGAVDVDPRLLLARALGDARRALQRAARPGDEGQDCPAALAMLLAAITGPPR